MQTTIAYIKAGYRNSLSDEIVVEKPGRQTRRQKKALQNWCRPLRGWKTRPKKEHHPTEEDGQIGTNHSLPLERGALFNRFFR